MSHIKFGSEFGEIRRRFWTPVEKKSIALFCRNQHQSSNNLAKERNENLQKWEISYLESEFGGISTVPRKRNRIIKTLR